MIVICVQTLAPTTGSGQFTNDVVNLKHQGAGQKLMIGWHKHQGVSETPKSADVICEQPLMASHGNGMLKTSNQMFKLRLQLQLSLK